MRRRNKTGGKEGKTQRPKTLKRHNAPKTARRRNFSAAGPQEQISALTRELKEALEQQTATSEVLKVISSSPGELEPVFNAMLANATRICEAKFGHLWLFEQCFRAVAVHGPQGFVDHMRHHPIVDLQSSPGIPLDRLAKTRELVHIPDLRADDSYIRKATPQIVALVETSGARTFVAVPMLKDGELIGAINFIARRYVRSPTGRSNWSRTSPIKPSSPSRTRGCSTSCASALMISPSHWSSRLRPRRC